MKKNNTIVLRDDIAIKYTLKMHYLTSIYPTQSDFVFDCVNYYLTTVKKTLHDFNQIEISKQDLKIIFGEKLTDPVFVRKVKDTIKQMIELGKIQKKDDDVLIIKLESLSEIYKIA